MSQRQLQVAVWFLLPVVGLLLLVVVLAGRGGWFVIVPTVALVGIIALIAWLTVRGNNA